MEGTVPEGRGRRLMLALSSAFALWASMAAYEVGVQSESLLRYMPLWMVLVCFPSALIFQNEVVKMLKSEGANPAERDLRRSAGFFIGAIVVYGGELIGVAISGQWSFKPGIIAILFFYPGVLFLLRSGLMELVYRLRKAEWGEEVRRRASGCSDSVLIAAHAVAPFFISRVPGYRGAALILVAAGLRLAWGYVPEDRLMVVREFIRFLGERKLWWMAPIFIVLAFLMVLVLLTQSTGGGFPFIYAVF